MDNTEEEAPAVVDLEAMAETPPTPEEQLEWAREREEYLEARIHTLEKAALDSVFGDRASNFVSHAKRELELAGLFDKDSDYDGMLGEAAMELIGLFSWQGHSGFSAGIVRDIFNRLANYETLTENDHSLYNDVSEMYGHPEGTNFQCSRDSKYFSDDGGETWYNVEDKTMYVGTDGETVDKNGDPV